MDRRRQRFSITWNRHRDLLVGWLILQAILLPGCSLGVMFGKMVKGDPLQDCRFTTMTKIDLTKGKHSMLVLCTLPDRVETENSSVKIELMEGVTRLMRREKIRVISADKVADWLDEHGGPPRDASELAQDFETDYIAWIDLDHFTIHEEHSSKLNRGRCSGHIRVFKVETVGSRQLAAQVFNTEFTSVYPRHQPITELSRSKAVFHKEYVDHICRELAEHFYNHRPGQQF